LGDERFGGTRFVSVALFGASAEVFKPSVGSSLDFRLVLLWTEDDTVVVLADMFFLAGLMKERAVGSSAVGGDSELVEVEGRAEGQGWL
jgi:hypothetical protein